MPSVLWLAVVPFVAQCEGVSAGTGCESCHPVEAKSYGATRMASAMMPVLESAFAQRIETLALHEPGDGYRFVFKKNASNLTVVSYRDAESALGTIDWVLGSGAQGQTPIVKSAQGFLESRVSFFPQLQQYGITVGQSGARSNSAADSLGRPKTQKELGECLGCHAIVLDASAARVVPGVQCEQCHPGAKLHAAGKGAALNPGKLQAGEQVKLCGNCHRVSPPVNDTQLENVRFQPLRLMKSRCFRTGKLSCTTCHVAHRDALRNAPAFYNAKCSGCHGGANGHVAGAPSQIDARAHIDARAQGDCIGCHMPQVQLHPALKFTDHFIRIVRATDYPSGRMVERGGE